MEANIKKCCPNCSQFYHLKSLTADNHGSIPLLLSCGHSMCEKCIRDIVKFAEPIECKVCHKDMEIGTADLSSLTQTKSTIYKLFPVNFYMLGELALHKIQDKEENEDVRDKNFYIDVKTILETSSKAEGLCMECYSPTTKMCQQCGIIVCNNCFNKSHKNFIIFKNHVLQNIESLQDQSTCATHITKPLEYYCKDCNKAACVDCLMVGGEKSCKNHNVISLQESNMEVLMKVKEIEPEVKDNLKRLTKAALDVGNALTNLQNDSSRVLGLTNEIDQHFSCLSAIIQKKKQEITQKLVKLKMDEQNSLLESRTQIIENIKKAKQIIDAIDSLNIKNLRQVNLTALLEDAKLILKQPWYLTCDTMDFLKINVDTKVFDTIENFISLEECGSAKYELLSSEQLAEMKKEIPPPPPSIVYPPEIKDVRQSKKQVEKEKIKVEKEKTKVEIDKTKVEKDKTKVEKPALIRSVPKYRSKSGSCSSLNSMNSDSSHSNYSQNVQQNYSYSPGNTNNQPAFHSHSQMKPFLAGDQDIVYISHIVDPHNFFVQRACHQSLVDELLREFRNASSMPKPSLNHITEGKIYLVFTKADQLWQRCRVMNVLQNDTKPMFKVFCFDFGSIETVNIDKLRLIPSFRLQNPPPLAINCSLDSCQPVSGSWTSEDAVLIQNIIDNKQAVLMVKGVVGGAGSGPVRVRCDLATFEHGVSLAHALAFHGRARLAPRTPYPKILGIKEKPKIFASNNDFKPNSKEEVFITYVVCPDKFFIRKHHLENVFEKLSNDLNEELNINDTTGTIYLPEIEMVCAVNVEGVEGVTQVAGASWRRARVRELPGRARVRVMLLDSGHEPLVHWTALRRLHDKFCTLRALATECHLAGVTPLNQKWNAGSVELLRSFEGRALTAHVETGRGHSSVGVTLYDHTDPEDPLCLNTLMIQRKYAVSFGMFMFNKNTETDDMVRTNKSPLQEKKPAAKTKKNVQILKRNESAIYEALKEKDLNAKDKGPYRIEVKLLNYQSPSLLYVSVVDQQEMFTELFEKIQTYYGKKPTEGRDGWNVGDRCCTICNQSQTWRRAVILELQGENAKVFYSDFAVVETVPISGLRELPSEFMKCGDAAIMCHLSGVIPAVGEEWPSLTKEYLKDLLDAYPRLFITRNGAFKDKNLPVELWVFHTVQGGALDPNVSEWRCLNKKIIEQGLGIPDKTQTMPSTDTPENSKEQTLSFLNLTGSIDDWLQMEHMPLKPLKIEQDVDSNTQSSTPSEVDADKPESNAQDSNTVFISDWLPPEPLPNKEFTAVPTYIDNDGIIYLHDVEQQETLDLIRKALDVRFKNPDPKAKFVKWTVGEPCVALYFLDKKFYRGRVIEVNNETSSCLIHYIDYGNEEVCPFVNIRKSIALYQIPIQAHKCILGRIKPVGKHWDRQTLDYIHKSIVEKECHTEIIGEPMGDIIPVNLKYNKLNINEHLVEFEMAEFTDGSKAKVQKFMPNVKSNKKLDKSLEQFPSDSEPDYIIEDEDESHSQNSSASFDMEKYMNKGWNEIIDEENREAFAGRFITFPSITSTEFLCNISVINEIETLEISIILDENTKLQYDTMFEELQDDGDDLFALDGIFKNKACVALFHEDKKWYRAIILQYSEAKARIKVKYVDYGNVEVVSVSDVREISEKYIKLPPATVTATLHGVDLNPNFSKEAVFDYYCQTFLDKGPFKAKVIDHKQSLPEVTLHNDNGDLVYEELFNSIFLKSE